jgi:hypothetical protein
MASTAARWWMRGLTDGSGLYSAGIAAPDIRGSQLNVEHRGTDLSVPHQLLQGGWGDAGSHHRCPEGVSNPVWIGLCDVTAPAMLPEQGAQSGERHGMPAVTAFERDEQSG